MTAIPTFIPLATFFDALANARINLLADTKRYVSLAMAIGAFFLVVYMLRLAYSLTSDERGSGFGGFRLTDVIRPVVLLVLIGSYPTVIGAVDDLFSTITVTLMSVNKGDDLDYSKVFDAIEAIAEQEEGNADATETAINDGTESSVKARAISNGVYNPLTQSEKNRSTQLSSGGRFFGNEDEYQALKDKDYKARTFENDLHKILDQYNRSERKGTRKTWIHKLVSVIYDCTYALIQAFAELYLSVLAVFGIFALAFSVIESWKNTALTWLGKYIEISFWKVTATIILSVTDIARKAALDSVKDQCVNMLDSLAAGSAVDTSTMLTAHQAAWGATLICLAGIIAMFSVPAITNSALSLAGGAAMGGANTGGGLAASVTKGEHVGKAASGGLSTAKNIKSVIK